MTQIRLRGPGDVVAVLPYQLGYHPQDSIVAMSLRDRAVGLIARIDVPGPHHGEEACRQLVEPLQRDCPEAVMLVGYESRRGASLPALDALHRLLTDADLHVLDRLVVRHGRWFALDCKESCCPAEGVPVQAAADTPGVAEFVGLGVAPLSGREVLGELVAAVPEVAEKVASALSAATLSRSTDASTGSSTGPSNGPSTGSGSGPSPGPSLGTDPDPGLGTDPGTNPNGRRVALSRWALVCDVSGDGPEIESLEPEVVAELVLSLDDLALRDGLVAWMCPGSLPMDCLAPDVAAALSSCLPTPTWHHPAADTTQGLAGRRLVARWQALVRSVPDAHAAAPLTVLANLAWWRGDGALARSCLDRALEASPGYRLALLLDHMLDLGMRPGGGAGRAEGVVRAG